MAGDGPSGSRDLESRIILPEPRGNWANCETALDLCWVSALWEGMVKKELIADAHDAGILKISEETPLSMREYLHKTLLFTPSEPELEELLKIISNGYVDFSGLKKSRNRGLDPQDYVNDNFRRLLKTSALWPYPELDELDPGTELRFATMPYNEWQDLISTEGGRVTELLRDARSRRYREREQAIEELGREPTHLTIWKTQLPDYTLDRLGKHRSKTVWKDIYGLIRQDVMLSDILEGEDPTRRKVKLPDGCIRGPLKVVTVLQEDDPQYSSLINEPEHLRERSIKVFHPTIDRRFGPLIPGKFLESKKNFFLGQGSFANVEGHSNSSTSQERMRVSIDEKGNITSYPEIVALKKLKARPDSHEYQSLIKDLKKEARIYEKIGGRPGIAHAGWNDEEKAIVSERMRGNLIVHFNETKKALADDPRFSYSPESYYTPFDAAFFTVLEELMTMSVSMENFAHGDIRTDNFMIRERYNPRVILPDISSIDWERFHPAVLDYFRNDPLDTIFPSLDSDDELVLIDFGIARDTSERPGSYAEFASGTPWFSDESFYAWGQRPTREHDMRSLIGCLDWLVQDHVNKSIHRPEIREHPAFEQLSRRWEECQSFSRNRIYNFNDKDEEGKPISTLKNAWTKFWGIVPLLTTFGARPPCDSLYSKEDFSTCRIYKDNVQEITQRLRSLRGSSPEEKSEAFGRVFVPETDGDRWRARLSEYLQQFLGISRSSRTSVVRNYSAHYPKFNYRRLDNKGKHYSAEEVNTILAEGLTRAFEYVFRLDSGSPEVPVQAARSIDSYLKMATDTHQRKILMKTNINYIETVRALNDMIRHGLLNMHPRIPDILYSASYAHPGRRFSLDKDTRDLRVLDYLRRFRRYCRQPEEYKNRTIKKDMILETP